MRHRCPLDAGVRRPVPASPPATPTGADQPLEQPVADRRREEADDEAGGDDPAHTAGSEPTHTDSEEAAQYEPQQLVAERIFVHAGHGLRADPPQGLARPSRGAV